MAQRGQGFIRMLRDIGVIEEQEAEDVHSGHVASAGGAAKKISGAGEIMFVTGIERPDTAHGVFAFGILRFGGAGKPLLRLLAIDRNALADHGEHTEIAFGAGIVLLGQLVQQVQSEPNVAWLAGALENHDGEIELGGLGAGAGGTHEPFRGLGFIAVDTNAPAIEIAELILSIGIAEVGGLPVPVDSLGRIFGDAAADEVVASEAELIGNGMGQRIGGVVLIVEEGRGRDVLRGHRR